MTLRALLLLLSIAVSACAAPAVDSSALLDDIGFTSLSHPERSLPTSGTYTIAAGSGARWADAEERRAIDEAFRRALDDGLVARSFRRVDSRAATLRIAYVLGLDEELKPDEMPDRFGLSSDWMPPARAGDHLERGTAIVLVADALSGELLWRAAATGLAPRRAPLEERLGRIRALAERFAAEMPLRRP